MVISINIKASLDISQTSAIAQGSVIEIISDENRGAFKMSDHALKSAVGKYFGKVPDDVYVRRPTPWGDLYTTYGWEEVKKVLEPISAKVLGVRTEPVIVATKAFVNNSSVDATYNAGINHSVNNTISSSWNKQHQVMFEQKVSYKLDFLVAGAEGETKVSYSHSWGEGHAKSQEIALGSNMGVQVVLKPGQSITTSLSATRGTMDVEVLYAVRLDGKVAVNHSDTFKGHHFWAHDVNTVLKAGGLPTTLHTKEVLKIGFYSDGKITVSDNKSAKTLAAEPATFRR